MKFPMWHAAVATCVTLAATVAGATTPAHLWSFDSDYTDGGSVGGADGTPIDQGDGAVSITNVVGEYLVGEGGLKIAHSNADGTDYVDVIEQVFPTANPMSFTVNLFYKFDPSIGDDDARNFLFETTPNFSVGVGVGSADDAEWFFAGGPSDTSGPNVKDGQWHQAAIVWDKAVTNTASFYHDGALRDQVDIGAADFNQDGQAEGLHIGTFRAANDRNWVGFIDEFAIYHEALDAATVAGLYTSAFGVAPPDPNQPSIDSLGLVAPAGSKATYAFTGWAADIYASVDGPDNDLGDGGFAGGSYLRTQGAGDNTLEVTLTDLPEHNVINLGMILAQLDSLDPERDGDRFIVLVDGEEIFNEGFGYGTSTDGVFSDPAYNDPQGVATVTNVNLFGDANFPENMYDLGAHSALQAIPHTASTLTLTIIGRQNQAGGEFYGIDNLIVQTATIPEPTSGVLAACVALLGAARRRR